jgi:ribosome-interacting GTPase 1
VIGVSILDDASLDLFRDAVWELTGLLRVFTRRPGSNDADPLAMEPGSTVADVARAVHGELGARCRGAHIWGPSARSPGQFVGRDHHVADDDVVEMIG